MEANPPRPHLISEHEARGPHLFAALKAKWVVLRGIVWR